jgi:hypothetical protein
MLRTMTILGTVVGLMIFVAACATPVITVVETPEAPEAVETDEAEAVEVVEEAEEATTAVEVDQEEEMASPAESLAGVDTSNPKVNEILNQVPLVQHHYNPDTEEEWFTCASRGLGLNGVEPDPDGAIFVGANAGDFDIQGVVALFKIDPDGTISAVPQQTGGIFVDDEGTEHDSYTLEEALGFFASGDAVWTGEHGESGRIEDCDPQAGGD